MAAIGTKVEATFAKPDAQSHLWSERRDASRSLGDMLAAVASGQAHRLKQGRRRTARTEGDEADERGSRPLLPELWMGGDRVERKAAAAATTANRWQSCKLLPFGQAAELAEAARRRSSELLSCPSQRSNAIAAAWPNNGPRQSGGGGGGGDSERARELQQADGLELEELAIFDNTEQGGGHGARLVPAASSPTLTIGSENFSPKRTAAGRATRAQAQPIAAAQDAAGQQQLLPLSPASRAEKQDAADDNCWPSAGTKTKKQSSNGCARSAPDEHLAKLRVGQVHSWTAAHHRAWPAGPRSIESATCERPISLGHSSELGSGNRPDLSVQMQAGESFNESNSQTNQQVSKLGEQNSTRNRTTIAPSSTSRMVDLHGAAVQRRLRAASAWLAPGQSASYKVAQRQEGEVCAPSPSAGAKQQAASGQSQEAAARGRGRLRAPSVPGSGRQLEGRAALGQQGALGGRPGRSPVSLQRQTNARLARHKFKLQQQRQQQLADLERRERQLISQAAGRVQQKQQQQQVVAGAANCAPSASSATQTRGQAASSLCGQQRASGRQQVEIEVLEEILQETPSEERAASGRSSHLGQVFANLLQPLSNFVLGAQRPAEQASGQQVRELANSRPSTSQQHQSLVAPARRPCDMQGAPSGSRALEEPTGSRQVVVYVAAAAAHSSQAESRMEQSTAASGNNQQQSFAKRLAQSGPQFGMHHMLASGARNDRRPIEAQEDDQDSASVCSSSHSNSSQSSSTLSLNRPFCKICHLSSSKNGDKLISPCKCSGTMQYIHCGCLLKWLEISNRANEKAPLTCELCAHEYTWHKRFNFKRMQVPRCSYKDILLHCLFVLALVLMLLCAMASFFRSNFQANEGGGGDDDRELARGAPFRRTTFINSDPVSSPPGQARAAQEGAREGRSTIASRLASDEKYVLISAALFFLSFFLAIYAQSKTRDTLYGLIVKFAQMNSTYYITEYDHGTRTTQQATSGPSCKRADSKSSPLIEPGQRASAMATPSRQQAGTAIATLQSHRPTGGRESPAGHNRNHGRRNNAADRV